MCAGICIWLHVHMSACVVARGQHWALFFQYHPPIQDSPSRLE